MTEREICISYKGAKRPNEQTGILADLNCTDRVGIIGILVENGVELAWPTVRYLHRRLDGLDKKLSRKEKKRREIMEGGLGKVPDRLNREIEDGEGEYRKISGILSKAKAQEAK